MAEVALDKIAKAEQPKILCVDDKHQNLVALKRVLASFDVELVMASSGNEALKYVLEHEFALALLDVQMPEMDGYELAEIIRGDPQTQNVPIIFISAIFTDRLNVFKGYEKGAFSFITKPFDPIQLQNKVKFFIDKYLTERAYSQSKDQIVQLYENSPEMLFSVDASSGKILQANRRLMEITGYSETEIVGTALEDLIKEEEVRNSIKSGFEEFMQQGFIENIHLNFKNKKGHYVHVLWSASAIRNSKNEIIAANTIWTDITEKHMMQEALEQSFKKLEIRNEELESFVYLTSHQLQEPTQQILSFMKLLERDHRSQLDEEGAAFIDYSLQAAERMRQQVLALLSYLQLNYSQANEKILLFDLVGGIINEQKEEFEEQKIQIETCDLHYHILGESSQLKLMLGHLIENSVKFRGKDDLKLNIWGESEAGKVKLYLEDNGMGIEPQHMDRVFKMFQTLHSRDAFPGLGVGLAMAKKIMEMHQGHIELAPSRAFDSGLLVKLTFLASSS